MKPGARDSAARCAGVALRSCVMLALGVAVPSWAGCASPPPVQAGPLPDGTSAALRGAARSSLAPGQTGLEVATWQVTDPDGRLARTLDAFGQPSIGAFDAMAIARNGLLVRAVDAARLDELREALGGSAMDVRAWLGTSPGWREVASARTPGMLVEVDGIAKERPGTVVRLAARTWPLPMEDGTRIGVELVPQLVPEDASASLARHGGRLVGQTIGSSVIELELERGKAWVVTCTADGYVETDADAPAVALGDALSQGPPDPAAPPPAPSGKVGSRIVTPGAALFLAAPERFGAPARRTVLVLVPHLGSAPFPDRVGDGPMTSR